LAFDIDPTGLKSVLEDNVNASDKIVLLREYFNELKIKDRANDEINDSFKKAEIILSNIDFKKDHLMKLNNYLKNRGN